MNKYEKELILGILSKDENMPEWGGNEGYNEEQKKVFLDFNNFLETLQPKKMMEFTFMFLVRKHQLQDIMEKWI